MSIKLKIVIVLITFSILLILINFIKRKYIKEEYAVFWILIGIILIIVPVFSNYIDKLAQMLGIFYEPAFIFLLSILGILLILFHYSIVISKLTEQNKILAQDLGVLKNKLQQLEDDEKKKNPS